MQIQVCDNLKATFLGKEISCLIGKAGMTADKREGDLKTPIGIIRPLAVLYRAGKVVRPFSRLPTMKIRPFDGWCDDPRDKKYNQPVRFPYRARCETLYRTDHVYDLVLITDYNYPAAVKGKGSAIFIHLQRKDGSGTEGCLAFRPNDLKKIVSRVNLESYFFTSSLKDGLNAYEKLRMRLQARKKLTASARR